MDPGRADARGLDRAAAHARRWLQELPARRVPPTAGSDAVAAVGLCHLVEGLVDAARGHPGDPRRGRWVPLPLGGG